MKEKHNSKHLKVSKKGSTASAKLDKMALKSTKKGNSSKFSSNIGESQPKSAMNLAKIWHFIWYDDSILSWTVNIVLAFVIIRFLVYPGLGFLLGTPFPVVAVVSESMEHDAPFQTWWSNPMCCNSQCSVQNKPSDYYENEGIYFADFDTFPMKNGFDKGDIIILFRPENLKIGDIIVFQSKRPDPIIHRIIAENDVYETKGDNNCEQISNNLLNENSISPEAIYGKAAVRIPFLGWVKIVFVELLSAVRK